MRLLVSGPRTWRNKELVEKAIRKMDPAPAVIIHGDARGVDTLAGKVGREMDMLVIAFPADWDKHGRAAGPIRNRQMLDIGKPDKVLAFRYARRRTPGTENMIREARRGEVEVVIVEEEFLEATKL